MQGGKLQRVFRPWVARFDYRKQQSVSRKGTKAGSTRRLKYGCLRQSNEASLAGSFTPRRDGSHRGSRRLGRHTPTHLGPPTAVSQAFITKDFEDRTGYIIVTDPQGQTLQINRQLVVALLELPELKPPTSVLKAYELGQFTSLQATLTKLNAASPKIKIALAPYQDKFDAVVKPEIDKFRSGNVKINGVWMTREKHEADLAAITEAEQKRHAARELAIQRENERKEAERAEQERLAEIRRSEEERKEREARAVREAEAKKIADAEAAKIAEAEQTRERRASSGSTLNGYTWRTASLETRMRFCNACAARVQSRKPGITGNFIFDSLQEFYNSNDPKILSQPATDIAALTIAAY